MDLYELMIRLIKNEINKFDKKYDLYLSEHELEQLYKISNRHDLAHIIGNVLIKNRMLQLNSDLFNKYQKKVMRSLYRYENLNYDFGKIAKLLESEKIKFVPLKGTVLRNFYPEPWMRTSCDIDILIEKENMDKASKCLLEAGLKKGVESPHDITFITSSGSHIELHHSLIEEERVHNLDCVLNEVWKNITVHEGYSFWYDMNDEMFYFYHIAHMAKHILYGGCGVKPFVDLWILDNLNGADLVKRDKLLEQGGLLKFADAARNLAQIWFGNNEMDSISKSLETYIFAGGVYGSAENRITVQQQKKGGRTKYVFSKVFLPYNELKFQYPILQKHCWLTPFIEVYRWFKLIFGGKSKRTMKELKYTQNISSDKDDEIKNFLLSIGL